MTVRLIAERPYLAGSSRSDQRENLNSALSLTRLGSHSRLERHRSPWAIRVAILRHIEWLLRSRIGGSKFYLKKFRKSNPKQSEVIHDGATCHES